MKYVEPEFGLFFSSQAIKTYAWQCIKRSAAFNDSPREKNTERALHRPLPLSIISPRVSFRVSNKNQQKRKICNESDLMRSWIYCQKSNWRSASGINSGRKPTRACRVCPKLCVAFRRKSRKINFRTFANCYVYKLSFVLDSARSRLEYVLFPFGSFKCMRGLAHKWRQHSLESETEFGWITLNSHIITFLWSFHFVSSRKRSTSAPTSSDDDDGKFIFKSRREYVKLCVDDEAGAAEYVVERKNCVEVTHACHTGCGHTLAWFDLFTRGLVISAVGFAMGYALWESSTDCSSEWSGSDNFLFSQCCFQIYLFS